jgi:carbonic anhydrase/acetyltransferase-like protein (isoleucine patch superfamily)
MMNEVMSLVEMQEKFDSEWILVGDPETTESLEITKGRLLWHSKNRDEVYRKARELSPQSSAILYTGTIPEEGAIIL